MTFPDLLSLGVVGVFLWLHVRRIGAREPGLPSGPPTIPLLGNLHVFPTEFAHYRFTEWARQYGGIFSLKVGPGTTVVLTDAAIVKELMDKRSASTADRPPLYIADVVTGGLNMSLARYSDTWRRLRKAAHTILTPDATARHLPIQQAEATQLLFDILTTPEEFYTHAKRYANSVILSVLYGQRSPRYETPETTAFYKANHEWELVLEPGSTPPIDLVPILKYVPARWAKWKRDCKRTRELQRIVYFGLLDKTVERVKRGEGNGCYMEEIWIRREEFGLDREMMGYLGGVLIEGGSDTTSSFLHSLMLALMAYPEVQKKAQEEIDLVVGDQRMPTLDDLQHMPYIRAVILETHRFRPAAPLMLPHGASATEEYRGYIIPKGATIFVNTWGILHDPALYDDPEEFIPDRYLDSENGTKPGVDGSDLRQNFVFGVGRRICPGIYLAQNSLNINTMNLIWAFDFNPPSDATGRRIRPDLFAYMKGILTGPHPFACKIIPRTAEKAEMYHCRLLSTIILSVPHMNSIEFAFPGCQVIQPLWFNDGTLILHAGTSLFRVYGGLLADRSPIFHDMLQIPQPPGGGETFAGCPVVYLSDDPHHLKCFLLALFDHEFFPPSPATTDFPILYGVLRLSTKYQVDSLRKRALCHLASIVTSTAAEYRANDEGESLRIDPKDWLRVVVLARELSILWVLPIALYRTTAYCTAAEIFQGIDFDDAVGSGTSTRWSMNPDDQVLCLTQARELTSSGISAVVDCFLNPSTAPGCFTPPHCMRRRLKSFRRIEGRRKRAFPLKIWREKDWEGVAACEVCMLAMKEAHSAALEVLWDELPGRFGLPEWDVLRQMKESDLTG